MEIGTCCAAWPSVNAARKAQKNRMNFLHQQLFTTPYWMLDQNIVNKIKPAGSLEKIRAMQVRGLNNLLSFDRLARVIENETLNGINAYPLMEMMNDITVGLWKEVKEGKTPDTYRRNLQRAHIERLAYLLREEQKLTDYQRQSGGTTNVNVSQSDIRAASRSELNKLYKLINLKRKTSKGKGKAHLEDAKSRISLLLDLDE